MFASPDPSQDDRAPGPFQVWRARVEFVADRSNDYVGAQNVLLQWDRPGARVAELLVELWKAHQAEMVAKADAAPPQDPFG